MRGSTLAVASNMKDWPPQVPDLRMFYEFSTGLLTYLKWTSDLPNKFTEGTDLSIALSLKYKCQELDKWKNAKMPFISLLRRLFVLLIVSVLQPIETRVFINQQHMHFVGTKEKDIQSTGAT